MILAYDFGSIDGAAFILNILEKALMSFGGWRAASCLMNEENILAAHAGEKENKRLVMHIKVMPSKAKTSLGLRYHIGGNATQPSPLSLVNIFLIIFH